MSETHPDLAAEQAHVAAAYAHLAAMASTTRRVADAARRAGEDGEVDSSIAAAHLGQRLRHLDPDVPGLVFGRIDEEAGARWHVGRRHVEDAAGDAVVVDWRAPVSIPFYRATPVDPQALARRRRFLVDGKDVLDLFDEVFDDPDLAGEVRAAGIPDPLLAELERSRTGAMRDIVATIAAEQDEVIRADLDTCLIVQGGPGTGKTAVGLHRAAFLLYEHRERLDRDGVLVVGPNPVFLRYISQVLPSLGEAAARQSTVERLVAGAVDQHVRAVDGPARAALLGDARMAAVVEAAVTGQRRPPTADVVIGTPWGRITLPADAVAAVLDEIAGRGVPWTVGRGAVRTRLVALAVEAHLARHPDVEGGPPGLEAGIRTSPDLRAALATLWPSAGAATLVRRLLTSRTALRRAATGILDAEEQALLLRAAAPRLDEERWTAAEAVVVDEAVHRIDGVPRTYGHLVADEAQDLSPMALRALARRCPSASMTILGDLAQATEPAATASWDETLRHLGSPPTARREDLSVGYRVPAAAMALADRLLPRVAPGLAPTRSVRVGGREPRRLAVADPDGLEAAAVAAVEDLAAAWSSVGVVVPGPERRDALGRALVAAGVDAGQGVRAVTGAPVSVVSPAEAKGLEFDGVVVVEPARFAEEALDEAAAGRLLYIALTRAVQELVVVHAEPLPAELAG
ncbi:MAG TPA: ATP-binding domain-containing protein [Iamia sp.]|nr:ATP-binding domain-containing protein [Iamia sp.]